VVGRIYDLSEDIQHQLSKGVANFIVYSVVIVESTDVRDMAQLLIYIHGADVDVKVTEELVKTVPMSGITKLMIFL